MLIYTSNPDKRYFYGKKDVNFIKYKIRSRLSIYESQRDTKYIEFYDYVNIISQDTVYSNINGISFDVTFFPFFRFNFAQFVEDPTDVDLDLRSMLIIIITFKNKRIMTLRNKRVSNEISNILKQTTKKLNIRKDLYVIKLGAIKNGYYLFKRHKG